VEHGSLRTMFRSLGRARSAATATRSRRVLRARLHQRGCVAVPVRRDHVVLRGRGRGRPAQGRLLQGTPGRPADHGRAAGGPGRVPVGDRLLGGQQGRDATIIPIIRQFQARHSIEAMVVVADAGMLSAGNLKDLRRGRAAVHRRLAGDQGPDRPGLALPLARGRVHRRSGHRHPHPAGGSTTTARGVNDPKKRAEPVWDPGEHDGSWRAVWAYSAKRAARDAKTLTLQENRAKAVIAGEKAARTPRFVKTSNGSRSLDEASLARARRWSASRGTSPTSPRGDARR
jgi:hypothetical protein